MMKINIRKGSTFLWTLRPETALQKYIPITAITMSDTGVRLAVEAHGMVEGWRFRVTRCKGLTRLNTVDEDHPRASDYFQATVVDVDTVEINTQNTTGDKAYTGGGILQYGVPMDLTGCVVRAQIRPTVGASTLMLDLGLYATISVALAKIEFSVPDEITSAVVGRNGVLSVELEDSAGDVITLPPVPVEFLPEIVR